MTETQNIRIAARVTANELQALQVGGQLLSHALTAAAATPWTCSISPSADLASLDAGANIVIASLLPEMSAPETSWADLETRLRRTFIELCQKSPPVFICTILRVSGGTSGMDDDTLVRVRRLNLLATEISRESGAYVLDIDRVVAHTGARRLQTDLDLGGGAAAQVVGHFTAVTLAQNALDGLVNFEVQDAAKAQLDAAKPTIAEPEAASAITLRKNVMAIGRGRNRQVVAPVAYTVEDRYAGWLVRQVLRGAIGPREALGRLFHAVRRRGLWRSAGMLAAGLSKQVARKS